VTGLHPETEPHESGTLDVGDGNTVYWEVCGNPDGKPGVVLHGGPGSGCGRRWPRYFDPAAYRIVLFDQRGCGRSLPDAGDPRTDLAVNTTQHLLADVELLRSHLHIPASLVFGYSWGSTLALAYAQRHPDRVCGLVLGAVTTTTRREVRWVTRDVGRLFPEQWAHFRDGVPEAARDGDLAAAYADLLAHPDRAVRDRAARGWCAWEDTHVSLRTDRTPDPRYDDPGFRMTFARLVTHYWRHAACLEDGVLLRDAVRLAGIPGVLVHGRADVSSPPDIAWHLARSWPGSELVLVDDEAHSGPGMVSTLVATLDRFA
jgi:proline iminopeptidase